MKIAFLNLSKKDKDFVNDNLGEYSPLMLEGGIDENIDQLKEVEILSIFVGVQFTKEHIEKLPNLKLISTRSTGYDHIDIEAVKDAGIKVINVASYGTHTVAEFAFALILAVSRKVHDAYAALRQRGEASFELCEGFDLFGKTIGIVGVGNIGKNVARIARGFGMNILMSDMNPDENFAKEVAGKYVSLEDLVKESDIITLHVPYTKGTHHLIGEDLLGKFKKGSYLINTSRGKVVDTFYLIKAINSGNIAGAGLDVLESEEKKENIMTVLETEKDIEKLKDMIEVNQLLDMDNVVVTPHVAFDTVEAKEEIIKTSVDGIRDFVEGKEVQYI